MHYRNNFEDFPKVIGGLPSPPNQFPYHVQLQKSDGDLLCSGAILNSLFIITAAHCLFGNSLKSLKVIAGDHVRSVSEPHEQTREILWDIQHSGYNSTSKTNDIAIARLSTALDLNEFVSTIDLPKRGDDFTGQTAIGTGWGRVRLNATSYVSTKILQYAVLPIISKSKCSGIYRRNIPPGAMCAGLPFRDSCQGDSGGPLVCRHRGDNGKRVLCGIITHGIGCGYSGHPGINIEVPFYSSWIEDALSGKITPTRFAANDTKYYYPHSVNAPVSTFNCSNGKMIPFSFKCDSDNDCGDWTDEVNCTTYSGSPTLFQCSNGTHIRFHARCNGKNDCGDWGDELECIPQKAWGCGNDGSYTSYRNRCNGHKDCLNGSDELNCVITTTPLSYVCDNSITVDYSTICDGMDDCGDFSDELHCPHNNAHNGSSHFHCSSSRRTLPSIALCDNKNNCGDWEDELNCTAPDGSTHIFRCPNGRYIHNSSKCNFINDCGDWADEFNCVGVEGTPNSTIFLCESGKIVGKRMQCNGRNDCGDWSDEIGCIGSDGKSTTYLCDSGEITMQIHRCDGIRDCVDYSDEVGCFKSGSPTVFLCKSGAYTSWKNRCDSDNDCGDFSDEIGCDMPTIFFCTNGKIIKSGQKCNGLFDCGFWDTSDEAGCPYPIVSSFYGRTTTPSPPPIRSSCGIGRISCTMHPPYKGKCPPPSFICDGEEQCINGEDEFRCIDGAQRISILTTTTTTTTTTHRPGNSPTCPFSAYLCEGDGRVETCIPSKWKCDGRKDCPKGDDEDGCPPTQPPKKYAWNCSGEYKCPSWHNCIPYEWLCDGIQDCLNNEDEVGVNCTGKEAGIATVAASQVGFHHQFKAGRVLIESRPPCALNGSVRCPMGHCVLGKYVCDGEDDCFGGWDERNCTTTLMVGPSTTTALTTTTYPSTTTSDDEWGLDNETTTPPMESQMNSTTTTTFPTTNDDDDGEELDTPTTTMSASTPEQSSAVPEVVTTANSSRLQKYRYCLVGEFPCPGHLCIPSRYVCDGHVDCPGNEDEANCIKT